MELVHIHEGRVRFPAVARIVESRPSDVESKDRLNDELLLIVLSYSQRIGADGILDERAKVVDMRYVNRIHLIHYLEWSAMFG